MSTPDSTFIRGFVETAYQALDVGLNHEAPGWQSASKSALNYDVPGFRFALHYKTPRAYTLFLVRFPVEQLAVPLSSDEVGVAACVYDPLTYTSPTTSEDIVFVYQRQGRAPLSHQHGPGFQPVVNVFGNWIATRSLGSGEVNAEGECRRPDLTNGLSTDPHQPPWPGWPTAGT